MPLSAAERVKRQIEKLKADGKYEAFKLKRKAIAKKSREKIKEEMANLPRRVYSKKIAELRQKNRDRVRKFRESEKYTTTENPLRKATSQKQPSKKNIAGSEVSNSTVKSSDSTPALSIFEQSILLTSNATLQKTKPEQRPKRRSNCFNAKTQLQNLCETSTSIDSSPDEIFVQPEHDSTVNDDNSETCELSNSDNACQEISEEILDAVESALPTAQPSSADSVAAIQPNLSRKSINGGRMCKVLKSEPPIRKTYRTDGALRKAISRASQSLPKCSSKRKLVVIKLYEKFVGPLKRKVVRPRTSRLNQQVAESVVKFYERDDISRQAPGLKDFIRITDSDGMKTSVQIKHLMYPIRTVYKKYCDEMNATPLHLSKFFSLRPKHVVSVTKIPHTVCLCPYHENFIFAIDGLRKIVPELPEYGDTDDSFYKTFFCEPMTKSCWHNECNICKDVLRDTLLGIAANVDANVNVKWQAWKEFDWIKDGKVMGKRWKRVTESGFFTDLVKYILEIAPHFIPHAFVKREQSARYQDDIKCMDPRVATLQLDFAENPVCVYQKEIQRAHYNQNQVTLFTAASWICQKIRPHSVVSDNLDHTKTAIVPYVDRLLEEFPKETEVVKIWSDGPSKQFKNKFIAAALVPLEKKHHIKIEWNFFATSHGKGPVDGIGGALKRQVREKVMAGEAEVRNADEFVRAVDKNSKVNVILMNEGEANIRVASLNLLEIWNHAPNINGISNFHKISVVDGKVIGKLTSRTT